MFNDKYAQFGHQIKERNTEGLISNYSRDALSFARIRFHLKFNMAASRVHMSNVGVCGRPMYKRA